MKIASFIPPSAGPAGLAALSILAAAGLSSCQTEAQRRDGAVVPLAVHAVDASSTASSTGSSTGQELEEGGGSMDSVGLVEVPVETSGREAPVEKKSPKERLDAAVEAKVKADQKRTYAEADFAIAKLGRDAGEVEIAEALQAKRDGLEAAREELTRFEAQDSKVQVREADLGLERSRDRLLKAETDLANMREIMSEEAEAKNKGEIIRRYEKTYEFAQESLSIAVAKRALKVDAELPAKMAKLAGAVRSAEAALHAKELNAEKDRRAGKLKVLKARHAFDAAKRDVKKAVKTVGKARKKVGPKAGQANGKDKKKAGKGANGKDAKKGKDAK